MLILGLFAFGRPLLYLATWIVTATLSILVHELGHALLAKRFGRRPSIVLHGMGGLTTFAGGLSRGRSIAVSLAGPLSGIALVGVPALLLARTSLGSELPWAQILDDAAFTGIAWSVLNLLPVLPLDGGNVLADVIGERPARVVSIVVAAAGGVYAYANGYVFGALFAFFFIGDNYSRLRTVRRPALSGRELQRQLHSLGRHRESVDVGQHLLQGGSGPERAAVAYDLARSTSRLGDIDGALRWLDLAVRLGFDDGERLDAEQDLRPVRATDGFTELRSRIS